MTSKQPSIHIRLVSIEILGPEIEPHQVSWILAITVQLDYMISKVRSASKRPCDVEREVLYAAILQKEWDKSLFLSSVDLLLTATSSFDHGRTAAPLSCDCLTGLYAAIPSADASHQPASASSRLRQSSAGHFIPCRATICS